MSSANPNVMSSSPTDWDEWLSLAMGGNPAKGLGQLATDAGGEADVAQITTASEGKAE